MSETAFPGLNPLLEPDWRDWILSNLARGCTPETLTEVLREKGFEPVAAAATVALFAHRYRDRPVPREPSPSQRGEPVAANASNRLQLEDREVFVAARLERPAVLVIADLLSAEECECLIEWSRAKLARSTVVNPRTGAGDFDRDRSSSGTYFSLAENDQIARLDRRLAALTGHPVANGEGIQILRYGIGGEYKPHFDYFPPEEPGSAAHLARGGQRVATVVMYLNDVEAGGETYFPRAGGLRIVPRRGWATLFINCDGAGRVDPATLHGGAPVQKGEKWIATKWIRERAYA